MIWTTKNEPDPIQLLKLISGSEHDPIPEISVGIGSGNRIDPTDCQSWPEGFGQDISGLRCGEDMTNVYFPRVVGHADVVMAHVDVFCSRMIDIVLDILES